MDKAKNSATTDSPVPGSENDYKKPVADPVDKRRVTGIAWVILVVSVLTSTFLFALDNTVVANIRPAIIHDLGHIEKLTWVSVGYVLGEACVNPTWGKLYRRFDNKLLYCLAVAIFDVGSAVCGSAPTIDALIVGRVIAGVGGVGMYVGALNIMSALTLVQERAFYLGFVVILWGLGTILGPIIGGGFADSSATWRWAFYLNLCISGLAAPVYLWILPSNPSNLETEGTKRFRRFDFVGTVLFVGAFLTLVMILVFGGQLYPWNSGQVITVVVLAAVLWVSFGFQQSYCLLTSSEERVFAVHFCREKEMCILYAETAIGASCTVLPIYFLPLYFQFVQGSTALEAGVRTLPFMASVVAGCLVFGVLFKRLSLYLAWFVAGTGLSLTGYGLLTTINPHLSDSRIYGFSVIAGLGAGLFVQAAFAVGQAIQPEEKHADVTAFLSLGQVNGASLSIGVGTCVFVNRALDGIYSLLPGVPQSKVQALIAGAGSEILDELQTEQKQMILDTLTSAIRDVLIMLVATAGLGFCLSFCMYRRRLFT